MRRPRGLPVVLAGLLGTGAALAACGGGDAPVAPTTGALELSLALTGTRPDPDGVVVRLDGGADRPLASTSALRLAGLAPGAHTLTVTGLAFNCTLAAPLAPVTVTAGVTSRLVVPVSCGPYLRDAIVYVSAAYGLPELVAARPDGSASVRLTADQATYTSPAVSPDGESIAAASRVNGAWDSIYLFDADGGNRRLLVRDAGGAGGPTWAPDGTRLAFGAGGAGADGRRTRLMLVNRDGTDVRPLSPNPGPYTSDGYPAWSPDGSRILFTRGFDLYTVRPDGTGLTRVVDCLHLCKEPTWSPDGRQIAVSRVADHDGDGFPEGRYQVWVMQADGSLPRRLTTSPWQEDSPSWSPDGTALVFTRTEFDSGPRGRTRVLRVGADGTGETEILGIASGHAPVWSPVR
jgi:Tol biopolymer transport system component